MSEREYVLEHATETEPAGEQDYVGRIGQETDADTVGTLETYLEKGRNYVLDVASGSVSIAEMCAPEIAANDMEYDERENAVRYRLTDDSSTATLYRQIVPSYLHRDSIDDEKADAVVTGITYGLWMAGQTQGVGLPVPADTMMDQEDFEETVEQAVHDRVDETDAEYIIIETDHGWTRELPATPENEEHVAEDATQYMTEELESGQGTKQDSP